YARTGEWSRFSLAATVGHVGEPTGAHDVDLDVSRIVLISNPQCLIPNPERSSPPASNIRSRVGCSGRSIRKSYRQRAGQLSIEVEHRRSLDAEVIGCIC